MKKIVIAILVLAVLVTAGVFIFVATFNIDGYRPAIQSKIAHAVGQRVELGKLSLEWKNGISIKADGFKVYPEDGGLERISASAESGSFSIEILPMLKKEFRVGTVLLVKPYIEVLREADGRLVVAGIRNVPAGTGGQKTSAGPAAMPLFFVRMIEIKGGDVGLVDMMANPPRRLVIKQIDVKVRNISPGGAIPFEAAMALFSKGQNISFNGVLNISKDGAPVSLTDGTAKIDIGALDIVEAVKAFPEIGQIGLKDAPRGILNATITKLPLADPIRGSEAALRYAGGRINLMQLPEPIDNINMDAGMKNDSLKLDSLSASFAGGSISVKGNVNRFSTDKVSDLAVSIEVLDLGRVLPKASLGEPFISGHASFDFRGTAQGLTAPELQNSLAGEGSLSIKDGVIVNMNVVRNVFGQLSMIPGLVETLEARLPSSYRATLQDRDTVLRPLEIPFTCRGGYLQFPELSVVTDHFSIVGKGEAGFDRSIGAKVLLRINKDLSAAFTRSINDLQYLMNSSGEFEIPIKVKGYLPQVEIIPDLSYAASKFALAKTQEVAMEAMSKYLKKDEAVAGAATAQQAQPQQTTAQTTESMLMDVIRKQMSGGSEQ